MLFGALLGSSLGIPKNGSTIVMMVSIGNTLLSTFLFLVTSMRAGWLAQTGQKKYDLIRVLAIHITLQGTSFRGSNLNDADFTQAILNNTDFKQVNLARTHWFNAHGLTYACAEGTYLEQDQVRQLVIAKQGQSQSFNYYNLRGLNLQGADLRDASFIGTDLSNSNLQNADLSGAKLVHSQLYNADLSDAHLTGAYIEDWGISVETQLEGILCDYIYMHLPTKEDPDPCRKPDNRDESFAPGDFANFIAPIIKTLGLYHQQNVDLREVANTYSTIDLFHHQGIDPAAAAISFQQLADQHPDAGIEIVALEGRGHDKNSSTSTSCQRSGSL